MKILRGCKTTLFLLSCGATVRCEESINGLREVVRSCVIVPFGYICQSDLLDQEAL
jgi:hypothetical protein